MHDIRVVPTTDDYVAGFNRCVGIVARERRYIGLVEAPPIEASRAFFQSVLDGRGAHFVAVSAAADVVGWCDIVRYTLEGFQHCGRLGMGLVPEVRGQGVGTRLASATIDHARAQGIERVELEVFAANTRAIALYERLGFGHEGVRRRARKLDGAYEDNVLMALVFGAPTHRVGSEPGA